MENASAKCESWAEQRDWLDNSFIPEQSFPRLNVRFMCHHLICSILSSNADSVALISQGWHLSEQEANRIDLNKQEHEPVSNIFDHYQRAIDKTEASEKRYR